MKKYIALSILGLMLHSSAYSSDLKKKLEWYHPVKEGAKYGAYSSALTSLPFFLLGARAAGIRYALAPAAFATAVSTTFGAIAGGAIDKCSKKRKEAMERARLTGMGIGATAGVVTNITIYGAALAFGGLIEFIGFVKR